MRWMIGLLVLFLSACSTPDAGQTRYFVAMNFSAPLEINYGWSSDNHGGVRVFEVQPHASGRSLEIIGDTLDMFITDKFNDLFKGVPYAWSSDIYLTPFTDILPAELRSKHIFPDAKDSVYFYTFSNLYIISSKPNLMFDAMAGYLLEEQKYNQ